MINLFVNNECFFINKSVFKNFVCIVILLIQSSSQQADQIQILDMGCFLLKYTFGRYYEDEKSMKCFTHYSVHDAKNVLDPLLGWYTKDVVIEAVGVLKEVHEKGSEFLHERSKDIITDDDFETSKKYCVVYVINEFFDIGTCKENNALIIDCINTQTLAKK
uniref:Uncharacterized protein n=1 Tax=Strongyloides venezuelensis TaxID=75913 RepID=A0A0K0G430_STRVS